MFARFVLSIVCTFALAAPAFSQVAEMARIDAGSKQYLLRVLVESRGSMGSAELIKTPEGKIRILTNHHVVGDAKEVLVQFPNEFWQKVPVLGTDSRADLALLGTPTNLPPYAKPIAFAKTPAKVGDQIFAIGYPLGSYNIAYGLVTSLTTPAIPGLRGMRTHQAPLTQGNSGGALVRLDDRSDPELVGINTAISGGDGNMSYFIPAAVAQNLLRKLENGAVVHAVMGVGLADATNVSPTAYTQITNRPYPPPRKGIIISAVGNGSSADRAGVKVGDMIVKCEAMNSGVWKQLPTGNSAEFSDEVFFNIEPGTRGRLTVLRGDRELTLDIEFAAASPS